MTEHDDPAAVLKVPIVEQRREVGRLLVRACVATRSLGTSRLPLRELGDAVHHSPQIFVNWLSGDVTPEIETLRDLEREAGITLEEWLVAFHLMPSREVAARSLSGISPARQEVLRLMDGWTEAEVRFAGRLTDLLVEELRKRRRRGLRPKGGDT